MAEYLTLGLRVLEVWSVAGLGVRVKSQASQFLHFIGRLDVIRCVN